MKTAIFKNPIVKNVLAAIAVAGFGFILLNLTFLFDFVVQSLARGLLRFFMPVDLMACAGCPPLMHLLFLVIIGLISWPIFKSKMRVLLKAIYLTVPLAVLFVTIGIFFYRWPIAVYSLGGLAASAIACYFYRTRQPWLYYYALILVGLTLAIGTLLGMEI